jgi:hypothetical protein
VPAYKGGNEWQQPIRPGTNSRGAVVQGHCELRQQHAHFHQRTPSRPITDSNKHSHFLRVMLLTDDDALAALLSEPTVGTLCGGRLVERTGSGCARVRKSV